MMKNVRREKIIKVFQVNEPVVRTKTLREHKITSRDLEELITMGEIVKIKTHDTGHFFYKLIHVAIKERNPLNEMYQLPTKRSHCAYRRKW